MSRSAVTRRVARGALFRQHEGIYSVGSEVLSREGEFLLMVFAGGPGSLLTSAAELELLGWRRQPAPLIDVVVPRKRRAPQGARFHESTIDRRDRRRYKGIPVASVPRLIVDLTEDHTPLEIAAVIREAAFHKRFSLPDARDAIARANGRRHIKRATQALDHYIAGSAGTRSGNEVRFVAMLNQAGVPEPRVNVKVEGFEVDFHWPDRRLIIEIDGSGHRRAANRREDALRDEVLTAKGWLVLRFAEDQLHQALEAATAPWC